LTIGGSAGIVGGVTEDKERPLGEWLRERREELGISLEQVEEDTRIRVRYLQALEAGSLEALPDPVVGRGFLRNYATYLELDPQEASKRYSQMLPGFVPEPMPIRETSSGSSEAFHPVPLHEMPGFRTQRRLLVVGVIVVVVAAIGGLAWWSYPYVVSMLFRAPAALLTGAPTATLQAEDAVPTALGATQAAPTATTSALPTATMVEATQTLELTLTPTLTPSPSPSPSPPVYTGVFLELVLSDTSWVQVTVDDVRQFQGELEAGTYKSWYGETRIVLRIGNAGAVQVTINGQNLGALGAQGEVVDRVFEKVGDLVTSLTATPTITGTAIIPVTGTATIPTTTTVTIQPSELSSTTEPALEPTGAVSPTATLSATETTTPTTSP
jgi:transcriptional regulator with XRE-family HTH domain